MDTTALELKKSPSSRTSARGQLLDTAPDAWGALTSFDGDRSSRQMMNEHLLQHGYLYLPGLLEPSAVARVRGALCHAMNEEGLLDSAFDPLECVPNPARVSGLGMDQGSANYDRIAADCAPLREVLYGNRVLAFFDTLLGGKARHYDYTLFRAVAPGLGTVPHCDIVYMGRGTHELFTMWTPLGDISLEMGGLMVLEDSHTTSVQARLAKYTSRDVDDFCTNRPLPEHVNLESRVDNKVWNGWLARNPVTLRQNLGGRWLTIEYSMGDVLIFSPNLVHGSLDNRSTRFRLSADSRYQRADQPIDHRFVGDGPYGHVGNAKRGRVC